MRVGLITPAYGPQGGGAGRLVQALARHLTELTGERAEVILHTQEEEFAREAQRDGVATKLFRPPAASVAALLSPGFQVRTLVPPKGAMRKRPLARSHVIPLGAAKESALIEIARRPVITKT